MTDINSKIRAVRIQITKNLNADFSVKNAALDERLSKQLDKLYAQQKRSQKNRTNELLDFME